MIIAPVAGLALAVTVALGPALDPDPLLMSKAEKSAAVRLGCAAAPSPFLGLKQNRCNRSNTGQEASSAVGRFHTGCVLRPLTPMGLSRRARRLSSCVRAP
jgi:hypothetical protein